MISIGSEEHREWCWLSDLGGTSETYLFWARYKDTHAAVISITEMHKNFYLELNLILDLKENTPMP